MKYSRGTPTEPEPIVRKRIKQAGLISLITFGFLNFFNGYLHVYDERSDGECRTKIEQEVPIGFDYSTRIGREIGYLIHGEGNNL